MANHDNCEHCTKGAVIKNETEGVEGISNSP